MRVRYVKSVRRMSVCESSHGVNAHEGRRIMP
jgi:hypothetical protein